MTTSSRLLAPASKHPNDVQERSQALGFSVNLDSGRGLLTTRHRRLGPLVVDTLSLEIPHLAFPFDVSGGAARFKKRRCALVHLAMHVDAADLLACLSEHDLRAHGFTRLSASVFEGFILLAGAFTHGDHAADFTCRIAPVVQGGRDVHLVFYDTRVYGFLPVPGAHLVRYLWRSLRWPDWFTERPAAWQMRPIDAFARELLPRGGWKIPAMQQLQDLSIVAHQGQLHVACGEANQPAARGPDTPTAALQATDGMALNSAAETALHAGNLTSAYEQLRRAVDDGQGSGWAALRLLHVGAALPQFAADLRHYAQQFLERGVPPDPRAADVGCLGNPWRQSSRRCGALRGPGAGCPEPAALPRCGFCVAGAEPCAGRYRPRGGAASRQRRRRAEPPASGGPRTHVSAAPQKW